MIIQCIDLHTIQMVVILIQNECVRPTSDRRAKLPIHMLLNSNLSSVLSTSTNLLLSIICRCILYVTISILGNAHHAKAARSATLKNRKIICPTKFFYYSIPYFEKGDHIDLTSHLKHILDECQFIQRCFHFMGSIPPINISPRYRLQL